GSVFLSEPTAAPALDPSQPLDPSSFESTSAPKDFREALDRIDINKIDPELVKSLRNNYRQDYSKRPKQWLKTEDDYVRFVGGHKSRQWKDPVGSEGEFQLYAALGRAH